MAEPLTPHEEKLLLVLAGKAKHKWGSWIGDAMAALQSRRFVKSEPKADGRSWTITDAGRAYLEERGL